MNKIKKTIAVLLSVMTCGIACVAVGCGGGSTDNTDNTEIITTGELVKDENGNVVFDDVSIKLTTVVSGADWATFQNIVKQFNNEYEDRISVTVNCIADGLFETQVADKITNNNNPPDVIMSHGKYHKNFADKKLIQPMNETIEKSGITIDFDNYSEGLMRNKYLGTSDQIYSLAADAQGIVPIYNKKLLKDLGYDAPPSNRADLLEVCKKFKETTGNAAIYWQDNGNNNDNFPEYSFCTAVLQNGGTLVNSKGQVDWYSDETNRKAFKDAMQAYRELYDKGYAIRNQGGGFNNFLQNKCIFYFAAPWHVEGLFKQVAEQNKVTEEVAARDYVGGASIAKWFALADSADKECANYIYGDSHCFAMTRSVSDINKKAAILEFFNWFTTSEKIGVKWARAGHITSCDTVLKSDAYKTDTFSSEFINNFYPNVNYFQSLPLFSVAADFKKTITSLYAGTVLIENYTDKTDETAMRGKESELNHSTDFFQK